MATNLKRSKVPRELIAKTPHGGSVTRAALAAAADWERRARTAKRWRLRAQRWERRAFVFGLLSGLEAIAITWLLLAGF